MKKLLLISILFISTSIFAQTEDLYSGTFSETISQQDMPIGKSFLAVPLDGTVSWAGVVDELTISYMPMNTPFILKVEGLDSKKFSLSSRKN